MLHYRVVELVEAITKIATGENEVQINETNDGKTVKVVATRR